MKWESYRNGEAAAQPPRPFSQQEAFNRISQVQAELDQAGPWPEHLTTWLQGNHPAALQAIRKATKGIDHACINQDTTGLEKELAEYRRAWLAGLSLWRESSFD